MFLVYSPMHDMQNNDAKNNFKMIRTKAKFDDVSPATLFDVLHDVDYKRVWDKHVLDVTEIGHIDHQNNVTYFSSENARFVFYLPPNFYNPSFCVAVRCPTPMKNRDFVVQSSWRSSLAGEAEEYILMNHSVIHSDYPPRKGHIRGTSHLTGTMSQTSVLHA